MKYCTHCGALLDDAAIFCPKCGCACGSYANPSQNSSRNYTQNNNSLSPLAIVGFVFAFINSLVGLICSIVAYKSAVADGNLRCKSFARAGIILSAVFFGLEIVLGIVLGVLIGLGNIDYPYYPDYYDWMF